MHHFYGFISGKFHEPYAVISDYSPVNIFDCPFHLSCVYRKSRPYTERPFPDLEIPAGYSPVNISAIDIRNLQAVKNSKLKRIVAANNFIVYKNVS